MEMKAVVFYQAFLIALCCAPATGTSLRVAASAVNGGCWKWLRKTWGQTEVTQLPTAVTGSAPTLYLGTCISQLGDPGKDRASKTGQRNSDHVGGVGDSRLPAACVGRKSYSKAVQRTWPGTVVCPAHSWVGDPLPQFSSHTNSSKAQGRCLGDGPVSRNLGDTVAWSAINFYLTFFVCLSIHPPICPLGCLPVCFPLSYNPSSCPFVTVVVFYCTKPCLFFMFMWEDGHHSPSDFVNPAVQAHRGAYPNRAATGFTERSVLGWV